MNNTKLRILERAYAQPHLTVGGMADRVGGGRRTERDVRHLVEKGYLLHERGLELSDKGFACIDSGSTRNRAKRVAKWALGMAASVLAVVTGNWLWDLIRSSV